jgi:hypothetical protein
VLGHLVLPEAPAQQLTVTIGFRQAPALDEREIDELIAFLATLEDGWGAR